MFDTMTITKTLGSVCGALLLFLLLGWAGDSLYTVGSGGGYGEEEVAQAYTIDTGEAEVEVADAGEAAPDFATLLASADASAGETVFRKCASCHKLDGSDGVGPHLNGVVGRAKGTAEGYQYSEALLARAGETWTAENIAGFIENPKGYMPGTKMNFGGLPGAEDRANLIAYLSTTN
ncbi:MAG: cytochrome c family protein [Rhodobacterales bacterium 32-66-7]|nr:MAG: cytochrome c family protein [Rhodobacterales bacterium 12-65-15]OYX22478.1 MAG: cytochrome c family protein [Rhodobacterales bacterium 32-66-7]